MSSVEKPISRHGDLKLSYRILRCPNVIMAALNTPLVKEVGPVYIDSQVSVDTVMKAILFQLSASMSTEVL